MTERMATAAELAEVRRSIYVPGWYEQDIPTLLAHIAYCHDLIARMNPGLRMPHALSAKETLLQEVDALLTEHRVGREGETRREP